MAVKKVGNGILSNYEMLCFCSDCMMRNIFPIVRASRGLYRWDGITNNIGEHFVLSVEMATG
jgi:hypothetical protein